MAELKRKEDLTTADLAGHARETEDKKRAGAEAHNAENRSLENQPAGQPRAGDEWSRPTLVKSESKAQREQEGKPGPVNPTTKSTPLFSESEVIDLRSRWSNVQSDFVDEPRRAVEEADKLVAAAMKRLADGFAAERSGLEKQWDRGDSVSTEDLRIALQRYRSFFDRLLNA